MLTAPSHRGYHQIHLVHSQSIRANKNGRRARWRLRRRASESSSYFLQSDGQAGQVCQHLHSGILCQLLQVVGQIHWRWKGHDPGGQQEGNGQLCHHPTAEVRMIDRKQISAQMIQPQQCHSFRSLCRGDGDVARS